MTRERELELEVSTALNCGLPSDRSLLLPVVSRVGGRVQAVVHRPVEPLHHTVPAGGGQRWHQGKRTPPHPVCGASSRDLSSRFNINQKCHLYSPGPRTEGSVGGPSRVGPRYSSLAQCTAGPVPPLPPASPQRRPTE